MNLNRWSRRFESFSLCSGADEREFEAAEASEDQSIDPAALALDDAIEQLYRDESDRSSWSRDASNEGENWMS
jgi:hypothetical protein